MMKLFLPVFLMIVAVFSIQPAHAECSKAQHSDFVFTNLSGETYDDNLNKCFDEGYDEGQTYGLLVGGGIAAGIAAVVLIAVFLVPEDDEDSALELTYGEVKLNNQSKLFYKPSLNIDRERGEYFGWQAGLKW